MEPRTDQVNLAKPSRRRAVALILVLAFTVLVAASVIGFFATATSARREASSYESGIAVRQLSEMVTSVVMGQIADGTRSWEIPPVSASAKGSGARLTYSTQPGLIRTYTDTGDAGRIFKLYSSDTMVTQPRSVWSVGGQLANEVPATWPAQPAHFVDLNQPVLFEDPSGVIKQADSSRYFSAAYPILDPLALLPVAGATVGVEGFDLSGIPGYKGGAGKPAISTTDDPTAPATAGTTSNPAPMPVRWIYVLQDGTFTVPNAATAGTLAADWSSLPDGSRLKPSKTNPITGRIAFWTDDETCKLNVNTAGEPTPWDTPRAITIQDLNYGRYQPAYQEYQRFPGHPFGTALSPVLFPGKKLTSAQKEDIYRIIPRLGTGGTLGATREIPRGISQGDAGYQSVKIALDSDRLYASADEFLFAPPATAGLRPENPNVAGSTLPKFKEQLKRSRFFLTASSRSPEVTLYGTPRISLWPVSSAAGTRTTFDTLAAFCASIGPDSTAKPSMPFYFQRQDATSPKADYDNIPRNKALYQYLQNLTSQPVPGYGGSFLQKWGADRDQVLTEIFDYIRCVNLRDPVQIQRGVARFADNGQVAPIQIGTTQGFGRYHTLSQFGFHFICAQDFPSDKAVAEGDIASASAAKLAKGERAIEASFLFSPFSASLGFYKMAEDLEYEVTFKTPLTIDGQDLKMVSGKTALNNRIGSGWHNNGREHGGPGGLRGPVQALGGGGYKYVSKAAPRVKIAAGATTMKFSGGTIEVKVSIKGSLIQTFQLDFPGGSFPVPKLVRSGTTAYRGCSATDMNFWWTFGQRYSRAGETPHAPNTEYAATTRRWADSGPSGFKAGGLFRAEDVVRSIVPEHGDLRHLAAKSQIAATEFVKARSAEWESPFSFVHVFVSSAGSHFLYGFGNEPGPQPSTDPASIPVAANDDQLVPGISYHYSRLPEIRPGAGKKYNLWGDFDNGMATWPDGAYINKPDEGSQGSTNSPYTYFAWNFQEATDSFFSPSRLVPSAGMFGSLPTGIKRHTAATPHAWETLLFRPQPGHPGEKFTPKDHLIMDLFWMPVGEPYPISEPFSTAGKVNLNYEIAPFSYIRRTTALRGAMKADEPLLLINSGSKIYKLWDHETNDHPFGLPSNGAGTDAQVRADWTKAYNGQVPFDKLRRPIDVEKTLKQADDRFAAGNAFRSATEICELHLVREGEDLASYKNGTIASGSLPTGDNVRERPYANLYAKLTTKSNTFNVHLRVQVLRKRTGQSADFAVWDESLDTVVAEHRGSALIERYVDASDPNLPDFATKTDATLDNCARFRIVSVNKFSP